MEDKEMQNPADTTVMMITAKIRQGIAARQYNPGEKVKEADLCRQFGVSRTPVREAFRLLQQEGLLIHNPQRGVQIPEFLPEELMNLQQMRTTLECLAARNAALHATADDIRKLREINERILVFDEMDTLKTNVLDREFHMMIAGIGKNSYVAEFLQNTLVRYELSSYLTPFQETRIPYTYKEHGDVITALEMNDQILADKYMSIHFHSSTLSLRKKLEKYMAETGKHRKGKKKI